MGANEDPAPPFAAEPAGPAQPSEDLEHWLRDLRTEVVANPSDWTDAAGDHPAEEPPARTPPARTPPVRMPPARTAPARMPPVPNPPARAEDTRGGGRHRAPD